MPFLLPPSWTRRLYPHQRNGRWVAVAEPERRCMPGCVVATDIEDSQPASPVAWVALTVDCPNAEVQEQLRQFYSSALGGEVVSGAVRARGWLLIFDVISDYQPPTWPEGQIPKQMHFELMVDDLHGAVSALQSMGATLADYQRPGDGGLRVMLDPAGHPFCVATAADVTPVFLDEASRQQR